MNRAVLYQLSYSVITIFHFKERFVVLAVVDSAFLVFQTSTLTTCVTVPFVTSVGLEPTFSLRTPRLKVWSETSYGYEAILGE